VREVSAKVDAKAGWLAAISGLPANPVYRYLRQPRRHPRRAWYIQRLRLLAVFAVPALVLTWLSAEATFILLDPHLTGVHRAIEWLFVFIAAQRYTGDGLGPLLLMLTVAGCTIWFAISVYCWTVKCSTLFSTQAGSGQPSFLGILVSNGTSPRSAVVAILCATCGSLTPSGIVWIIIYSVYKIIYYNNYDLTIYNATWQIYHHNASSVLIQVLSLALYMYLSIILNTLLFICFGSGSWIRYAAPVAGVLMVIAQITYTLRISYISAILREGLDLSDYHNIWRSLHPTAFLIGMSVIIGIVLAHCDPRIRSWCLTAWPLFLLYSMISPIIIMEYFEWSDMYLWDYLLYYIILPILCAVGMFRG
jgi:hypothetical protein